MMPCYCSLIVSRSCIVREECSTAMVANIVQNRNEVSDGDPCQSTDEVKSMETTHVCNSY